MNFSTTFTDKYLSMGIYAALLLTTVWAGGNLINQATDRMFIANFIGGWEQVAITLQEKEPHLLKAKGKQLVARMNQICLLAKKHSITLPTTNTDYAYAHILKKINQPEQQIFLIIDQDKLIIYGLHQQTMEKIDQHIDGNLNQTSGRFIAKEGKNTTTYTGILSL